MRSQTLVWPRAICWSESLRISRVTWRGEPFSGVLVTVIRDWRSSTRRPQGWVADGGGGGVVWARAGVAVSRAAAKPRRGGRVRILVLSNAFGDSRATRRSVFIASVLVGSHPEG